MDDLFFEDQGAQAPSNDPVLHRMMALATEVVETEAQIEAMEESLREVKSRCNHIKLMELPDLMSECGTPKFTLASGYTIEVQNFVSGALTKDPERRRNAIQWLASNGAIDLIKNEVSVEFGKTEHNIAKNLAQDLKEQGFEVQEQETVHHQTLLAFVRERMKKGEDTPLDDLGLYSGRKAEVKGPKKK